MRRWERAEKDRRARVLVCLIRELAGRAWFHAFDKISEKMQDLLCLETQPMYRPQKTASLHHGWCCSRFHIKGPAPPYDFDFYETRDRTF